MRNSGLHHILIDSHAIRFTRRSGGFNSFLVCAVFIAGCAAGYPLAQNDVAASSDRPLGCLDRIFRKDMPPDAAGELAAHKGRGPQLCRGLCRALSAAASLSVRAYAGRSDYFRSNCCGDQHRDLRICDFFTKKKFGSAVIENDSLIVNFVRT